MRVRPTLIASIVLALAGSSLSGPATAATFEAAITNGRAATPGSWPFMVALVQAGEPDAHQGQFCGGSLVAADWVLTAAHCLHSDEEGVTAPGAVELVVGATDLRTATTRVAVAEVIVHEGYDPVATVNDIALLRLATPQSTSTLRMAGDADRVLETAGTAVTLTGWGGLSTDQENQLSPSVLQEATMPVVDDETCSAQIGTIDGTTVVCAGAPEDDADGGIDACQGDSGGPLFATLPAGDHVQIGLVSWGPTCGRTYSAYTSVAALRGWIDGKVGGGTPTPVPPPALLNVERVAGASRYATAAELATSRWQAPVARAYVVTGSAFPDALAAGPVAAAHGGPILLTERDGVPGATLAALGALSPQEIVVVGGTGAISPAVEAALSPLAPGGVRRISGADRYQTAVALSQEAFADGLDPDGSLVMLASGTSFADAVGGSAASASSPATPLLLTAPGQLPDAVVAELQRLAPDRVVLLGGTAAVSDAVRAQLEALGLAVERVAGTDRYDTAALIATTLAGNGDGMVLVATGRNFPDALVAGALGLPLLLVPEGSVPASVQGALVALDASTALVLGGSSAVSDAQAGVIDGLLGGAG